MNVRRVLAVAARIALGFRRDHRSLGLLFVAPLVSDVAIRRWRHPPVPIPTTPTTSRSHAIGRARGLLRARPPHTTERQVPG